MEVRKEDQRDQDEKVVEIEIERLRDFKNHPFKVQADSQMKEYAEDNRGYYYRDLWHYLLGLCGEICSSQIFKRNVGRAEGSR